MNTVNDYDWIVSLSDDENDPDYIPSDNASDSDSDTDSDTDSESDSILLSDSDVASTTYMEAESKLTTENSNKDDMRPDPYTGYLYTKSDFMNYYNDNNEMWNVMESKKILKRHVIYSLMNQFPNLLEKDYLIKEFINTYN